MLGVGCWVLAMVVGYWLLAIGKTKTSHSSIPNTQYPIAHSPVMPLFEAVRLALDTIRVQKLKSFFTLLGVMIGVMFLIAVVSIVEGMTRYVQDDFIGRILGANTFTLHRAPDFRTTFREGIEWQRRPRIYHADVQLVRGALPPGTRWAIESQGNVAATSPYVARTRQVDAHAVEEIGRAHSE